MLRTPTLRHLWAESRAPDPAWTLMGVTWATHPLKMRRSLGTPKWRYPKLVSGPPRVAHSSARLLVRMRTEEPLPPCSQENYCKMSLGGCFLLVHTDEIWEEARESFVLPGSNIPVCHSAPGKKVILSYRLTPESQQSTHPQGALCFLNHRNNSVWWCSYKLLSTPDSMNERW